MIWYIQTQVSYWSPVQGRMAGVSTSVYKFDSVVRGQHKMYGLLLIEETHSVSYGKVTTT